MNWSPVPPAIAAVVAVVIAVTRRLPPILVGSAIPNPSPERVALYALGGRLVSFLLIYGLLFGAAFAVGRRRGSTDGDGATVLATGLGAAGAYLVASAALLLVLDPGQVVTNAVGVLGGSVGVGVQLAVVAFAGLALGDRI